jgi:hypothetical protein
MMRTFALVVGGGRRFGQFATLLYLFAGHPIVIGEVESAESAESVDLLFVVLLSVSSMKVPELSPDSCSRL